jgi:hypothetical protein
MHNVEEKTDDHDRPTPTSTIAAVAAHHSLLYQRWQIPTTSGTELLESKLCFGESIKSKITAVNYDFLEVNVCRVEVMRKCLD